MKSKTGNGHKLVPATRSADRMGDESTTQGGDGATPILGQSGREIQAFGSVVSMPIGLSDDVRRQVCERLNQILADTKTLADLYKKHHWQVSGHTFYQLHLLFDKHFGEQAELVDTVAERIQILGGVSVAMGGDVAELTRIPRPPKGRESVPVQISRLAQAHEMIITLARETASMAGDLGDEGTNDMLISDVVRTNELQAWFLTEHVVDTPLVKAEDA
jgi:starvation-inducible DNA-binding protein